MAWIRLDDQIAHHPKFIEAGLSSWLWVCCIAYAQKYLTNGYIPERAASALSTLPHIKKHLDILVKAGLLEKVEHGYQVHDYLDFNDTREEALAKKEAIRKQRRLAGIASGRSRRTKGTNREQTSNGPVEHVLNPIPMYVRTINNNKLISTFEEIARARSKDNGQPDSSEVHMENLSPEAERALSRSQETDQARQRMARTMRRGHQRGIHAGK